MAYAPLDEHFDEHPKFEQLELEHYGLMACAISYCNRNLTDGKVSFKAVRGFGRSGKGPKLVMKLTGLGIWRDIDSGWEIVGFLDHNPSKAEVLAKREIARLRKDNYRKGAAQTPPVPQPVPAGQPMGHHAGQAPGQHAGQDVGQKCSSLARAPAPAGGIRSTALHGTALQDPPLPPGGRGANERIVDLGPGAERAVEVFVECVSASTGRPFSLPNERSVRSSLVLSINTYLRGDGTIAGALDAMREAIPEWVETYREKPSITAGWHPRKFADWLAAEREDSSGEVPPPRGAIDEPEGPRTSITPEQHRANLATLAELEAEGFGGKFVGT